MSPRILQRGASCPNGGVFYSCNNGFVGCCLIEACNPGVGCPADKDLTPKRSSSQAALPTPISTTSTAIVTSISAIFPATSSSSQTTTTSDAPSSLSLVDPTAPTAVTEPSAHTNPADSKQQSDSGSAVPAAAIVGAVLGAVILIAIVVGFFFLVRQRRRTKVYKAAVYPSPHVGSDMSPQLPGYGASNTSRFAGWIGTKQIFARHSNTRADMPPAEMGEAPPRRLFCAELPASNDSMRNG